MTRRSSTRLLSDTLFAIYPSYTLLWALQHRCLFRTTLDPVEPPDGGCPCHRPLSNFSKFLKATFHFSPTLWTCCPNPGGFPASPQTTRVHWPPHIAYDVIRSRAGPNPTRGSTVKWETPTDTYRMHGAKGNLRHSLFHFLFFIPSVAGGGGSFFLLFLPFDFFFPSISIICRKCYGFDWWFIGSEWKEERNTNIGFAISLDGVVHLLFEIFSHRFYHSLFQKRTSEIFLSDATRESDSQVQLANLS